MSDSTAIWCMPHNYKEKSKKKKKPEQLQAPLMCLDIQMFSCE